MGVFRPLLHAGTALLVGASLLGTAAPARADWDDGARWGHHWPRPWHPWPRPYAWAPPPVYYPPPPVYYAPPPVYYRPPQTYFYFGF